MDIGANIIKLRKKLGITQREFASMVGVGASTACGWEKNTTPISSFDLPKIAKALRTTVAKLVS